MKKRIRRNFTLITAWLLACSLVGCQTNEASTESASCQPYFPGKTLTQTQFNELTKDWYLQAQSKYDRTKIDAFNQASEREFIEALYEMFSKPEEAHVFYGQYNTGDGAKDGGRGFRVIWSKGLTQGDDRRLLNVITFWDYKDGKLQLRTGHDTVRVRVQLAPDSQDGFGTKFGAASLSTNVEDDGRVEKVHLAAYADASGNPLDGIPGPAFASSCNGCHFGQLSHHISPPTKVGGGQPTDMRDEFQVDTTRFTAADNWNIQSFVTAFADLQTTDFQQPEKTFFPQEIVQALEKRCQQLH